MARSNVPKFGHWENEDNVPYTIYFDKARRNRGGKMINPNDPQENPELFANTDAPVRPSKPTPKPEHPTGRRTVRPTTDSDFRQFSNSPAQSDGGRGQRPSRSSRSNVGSEHGFERSPLNQAKVMGRGGGASPLWEVKNSDSSNGTPGRSRLRPATRPDESFDKGIVVPPFGNWNDQENLTDIFEKVREEKNTVPRNVPVGTRKHPSYATPSRVSTKSKNCCFGWW